MPRVLTSDKKLNSIAADVETHQSLVHWTFDGDYVNATAVGYQPLSAQPIGLHVAVFHDVSVYLSSSRIA